MAIDTIKSSAVLDGAIATADIADDAVTGAKIENNPTVAGNLATGGTLAIAGHGTVGNAGTIDAARALTVVGATDGTSSSIIVGYNSSLASKFSVRDDGYMVVGNGITLTDGNLVVADGHGIDFSANANAASMSSELLDDYEEGTFDPTISGESPCTITHSARAGYYTKVGRLVNVQISLTVGSISNGASNRAVSFGGLPFTTNTQQNGTGAIRIQSLGSSVNQLQVILFSNATGGRIEEFNGSGGTNSSDHVGVGTSFDISLTYSTA